MLAISSVHLELAGGWVPPPAPRRERVTRGLVCSVLLHLAVALLLILGPATDTRPPPDIEEAIPAELVTLGETASPAAPLPTVAAAPVETPRPEPIKPPGDARPLPPEPAPAPLAKAPPPAPKPEPLKPQLGPTPSASSQAEPQAPPQPQSAPLPDPSFTEFKEGQTIEQNAPAPEAPPLTGARVASSQPTTGSGAAPGQATYDVKDFIRIQIERRWRFDASTPGAGDWSVRVHLVLSPDGSVTSADIVPDSRMGTDPNFRAFAFSARDAVLVSSPLRLPVGTPRADLDLVLRFEARMALR